MDCSASFIGENLVCMIDLSFCLKCSIIYNVYNELVRNNYVNFAINYYGE